LQLNLSRLCVYNEKHVAIEINPLGKNHFVLYTFLRTRFSMFYKEITLQFLRTGIMPCRRYIDAVNMAARLVAHNELRNLIKLSVWPSALSKGTLRLFTAILCGSCMVKLFVFLWVE
jgi:hypothetical protein